ncbi:MAG: PEGA domain-containing protein [Methanomicrobiales archaeon]|nr:PEGA domain-containing protein [Methanomicrobiales archaeon]
MRITSMIIGCMLILLALTGCATGQEVIGGDAGYFAVESSPAEAQVIFDGVYYGNTPLAIPVYSTATPRHTITVSKSGYFPWTRTYASNPAPGETVRIVAILEPSSEFGTLTVTSSPVGALVTIDGGRGQQAPWTYTDIRAGSHIVRAFLSGYQPFLTIVSVPPGGSITVDATLAPLSEIGVLQVKSTPGGADVYVDGFYSGATAATIGNLAAGQHIVQLKLAGYREWIGTVDIPVNSVAFIDATLEIATADPVGNIVVTSQPSGASVYLDSNFQGRTQAGNPLDLTGIPPGTYSLEIQLTNYRDFITMVEVQAGKTAVVHAELVPATNPSGTGTLQVSSDPQGANIFLDNVCRGVTPLTIPTVEAGTHTLLLRLQGYHDYSSSITIAPGQALQVQAALSPAPTQTGFGAVVILGALLGAFLLSTRIR